MILLEFEENITPYVWFKELSGDKLEFSLKEDHGIPDIPILKIDFLGNELNANTQINIFKQMKIPMTIIEVDFLNLEGDKKSFRLDIEITKTSESIFIKDFVNFNELSQGSFEIQWGIKYKNTTYTYQDKCLIN